MTGQAKVVMQLSVDAFHPRIPVPAGAASRRRSIVVDYRFSVSKRGNIPGNPANEFLLLHFFVRSVFMQSGFIQVVKSMSQKSERGSSIPGRVLFGAALAMSLATGFGAVAQAQTDALEDALATKRAITEQMGKTGAPPDAEAGQGAGVGSAGNPQHVEAPLRKSGWWVFSSKTESGTPMGTQYQCIGPRSEAISSAFDQIVEGVSVAGQCSKRSFVQDGDIWKFDVLCGAPDSLMGGPMGSVGTVTGEIATAYTVHLAVTSQGSVTKGTIEAKRQGPCPADHKEGDYVINADTAGNILD